MPPRGTVGTWRRASGKIANRPEPSGRPQACGARAEGEENDQLATCCSGRFCRCDLGGVLRLLRHSTIATANRSGSAIAAGRARLERR
jgi:hypothetical protein